MSIFKVNGKDNDMRMTRTIVRRALAIRHNEEISELAGKIKTDGLVTEHNGKDKYSG